MSWKRLLLTGICVFSAGLWGQTAPRKPFTTGSEGGRPDRDHPPAMHLSGSGITTLGSWSSSTSISPTFWRPGDTLTVSSTLTITDAHVAGIIADGVKVDGFVLLVTAERNFDADGWLRMADDEKMSTLLTPTGLGIEGGVQGALTNRFGYGFRTPVDQLVTVPLAQAAHANGQRQVRFDIQTTLPQDLPPGIYRIRLDYGVTQAKSYYDLDCYSFTKRPFFNGLVAESHIFSPLIRASGTHASGRLVDANTLQPRLPWVLLWQYNSNGYQGVIADEDRSRFALSARNLIPDDVILPLYDANNKVLSYSLEPQFPTDTIEVCNNIPWDYARGQLSIQITGPDGKVTDLGTAPYAGNSGQWPTTKNSAFTAWKPPAYGYYTVKASGFLTDMSGNRIYGGGTYHFWIAKRLTMATATFQGFAYPVGGRYGRDMAFNPMVPADVDMDAYLYYNSSTVNPKHVHCHGTASAGGVYGALQGMTPLTFDGPGEYWGHILATYKDANGDLWVSSMRHAGVVYPTDSSIVARGKLLSIPGSTTLVQRGETHFEGWIDTPTDTQHLHHVNYPYNSGDVLLIASDHQGANKIIPNLTWEDAKNPVPAPNATHTTIGATNIQLHTSNGLSPHMFPEYITDWEYYYAGAPRPGFMSRFIVAEDGTRAPYWPVSPNAAGGQINASSNGDMVGDIYRLVGGVVIHKQGQAPAYAGYLASAFLIPRGSNNNRIIAPGTEDLTASDGHKGRFFLVGTRPGMLYQVGMTFTPAVQVDPIVPCTLNYVLTYPDGRTAVSTGPPDGTGSWAGTAAALDVPGIYHFTLTGDWQGFKGFMPGLPPSGGDIYVVESTHPANGDGMQLTLPPQSTFDVTKGLTITGASSAKSVHYAMIMPGAVLGEGDLTVTNGQFQFFFDPSAINGQFATYDTVNVVSGVRQAMHVVHLTFFSEEQSPTGVVYHSYVRVVLRGNTVLYAR